MIFSATIGFHVARSASSVLEAHCSWNCFRNVDLPVSYNQLEFEASCPQSYLIPPDQGELPSPLV